jgi:ferredoxin-NADP reductase
MSHTAKLLEWRELAPDVRHFVFEVPEVESLSYQPGQFVSLTHPIGGKLITRAYSISSLPEGNRFALCLNKVQDGHFSPHLFSMSAGDSVGLKGPLGTFVWRRPFADAFLVATGTGMAPMRAMILDELAREGDSRVTLILGARYPQGLLYGEEMQDLAERYPRFRYLPTLTRPPEAWSGRTGRVQAHLYAELEGVETPQVYLCGMKEMVDDIRATLKARGFDRKQIVSEKFD